MKAAGTKPTWTDVKTKLADFDRPALFGLVHDLYMADKDNQAFLHARFALAGGDVLKPYKATLAQTVSVQLHALYLDPEDPQAVRAVPYCTLARRNMSHR